METRAILEIENDRSIAPPALANCINSHIGSSGVHMDDVKLVTHMQLFFAKR